MLKIFLLFNLLFFVGDKGPKLGLKDDLAKDRRIINSEHADYNREVIKSSKAFAVYANLSLTGFHFEKRVTGKHTVLKWIKTTSPALCVYKVVSVLASDTIYKEQTMEWDSLTKKSVIKPGKQIKLKPVKFTFHTYIIQPATGKQLIYMTELRQGLHEYRIGQKSFYPVYESIALGIRFPDVQEILRLTAASK
jgi:hypothetical protein